MVEHGAGRGTYGVETIVERAVEVFEVHPRRTLVFGAWRGKSAFVQPTRPTDVDPMQQL